MHVPLQLPLVGIHADLGLFHLASDSCASRFDNPLMFRVKRLGTGDQVFECATTIEVVLRHALDMTSIL